MKIHPLFLAVALTAVSLLPSRAAAADTDAGTPLITDKSQLSSPFSDYLEGTDIGALIDGNVSTFWHSDWHNRTEGDFHWIDIDLQQEVKGLMTLYMHRRNAENDHPTSVVVSTSTDGTDWQVADTVVLPYTGFNGVNSDPWAVKDPVRYLRFTVIDCAGSGTGFRKIWHAAELQVYLLSAATDYSTDVSGLCINEVQVANIDRFLDPSNNYGGWIELYNPTDRVVSLADATLRHTDFDGVTETCRLSLSHGMVPAGGYKVLWFDHNSQDGIYGGASHLQIPFKLDPEGGDIALVRADGTVGPGLHYLPAIARCSYARQTDGGDQWGWTFAPTPGTSNQASTFATRRWDAPEVDTPSMVIDGRTNITVKIPAGATLRYTKDGSTPTASHGLTSVTGRFTVTSTTIYRFVLVSKDALPSPVVTRSYIRQTGEYYLPVLSVATDPDHLYDDQIGVYTKGTNGVSGKGQSSPCNWNMDWERPVNMEYLVPKDGTYEMALNQETDFKIAGGWSRAYGGGNGWPMKASFRLKAGKVYEGLNSFNYSFYSGQKKYNKYKTLQVRNGGNDTYARFIDPAIQQIIIRSGFYVDCQDWQPCHVFFNGDYLGMLNIRDNNNRNFGESQYGIDTDEMDHFEIDPTVGYVQGDGDKEAMKQWIGLARQLASDPTNDDLWQQICALVDVDEFCNYMAAECYIGAGDWLTNCNNLKGFRSRKDNGRFHFVMFDTDSGFSNDNMIGSLYAMLNGYDGRFSEFDGKNPIVENFFNMLKYVPFKRQFANAFSLVAGSVFTPERSKEIINGMVATTQAALAIEGNSPSGSANWLAGVISDTGRRSTRLRNLRAFLGLSAPYNVALGANIPQARILVGGQEVPTGTFDGQLFPPVTLTAKAPAGYVFRGWKAVSSEVSNTVLVPYKSQWAYYDKGSLDGKNWKDTDYDERGWATGKAPMGYGSVGTSAGLADYNTTLDYGGNASNKRPTYYFRHRFQLTSLPGEDERIYLYYYIDDGAIFYVNGVEVGTYNQLSGSQYADYSTSYESNVAAFGKVEVPASLLRMGNNTLAVEVHNTSGSSSDIFFEARMVLVSASSSIISEEETFCLSEAHESGTYTITACFDPVGDQMAMWQAGASPLRINEVSAGNDIHMNDRFKRNDWLEVYNTTAEDIDMEGMYLTDDRKEPLKYRISAEGTDASTVVPAHGHRIIWCDKLSPVNQLHAPFKLSNADGAYVGLQAADGTWADEMVYMEQPRWHTYGRYPDGGVMTALTGQPTIEWANQLGSYDFAAIGSTPWQDNVVAITLALAEGWNWTSHNLQQPAHSSRFTPYAQCIRSEQAEAVLAEDGQWEDLMDALHPAAGYKLKMTRPTDITLRGELYDLEQPVTVHEGWNWLGVPLYNATALEAALSDYLPAEGDAVVGLEGFATFEEGAWKGTLQALSPGRAYLMRCGQPQTFRWTALSQPASRQKRYAPARVTEEISSWQPQPHAYPNVMNAVAVLYADGVPVTEGDFQVAAFSGDECRGTGTLIDGRLFFTVHGEGGEPLAFRVADSGGQVFTASQTLAMQPDAIMGSRVQPFRLDVTATALRQPNVVSAKVVKVAYYNASGMRVSHPGPGITFQQTTYADGQTLVKKILR